MTTEKFWRRTVALAAVAAAAVALSGCGILNQVTNALSDAVDQNPETTQNIFSLEVGDCEAGSPAAGEFSDTTTIDCAKPHQSEIYAVSHVPDGDFPGDDTIGVQADADCLAEFETFLGVNWEDSVYDYTWYFPTKESWADGDREILCIVFDPEGNQVTGSLAGVAK